MCNDKAAGSRIGNAGNSFTVNFPHRGVLEARSEYSRGLLLSGIIGRGGRSEGGVKEIEMGEVSAGALRLELRFPTMRFAISEKIRIEKNVVNEDCQVRGAMKD